MVSREQDLVIIGHGPAGHGASLAAVEQGYKNITIVDSSPVVGSGGLDGLRIQSNSLGSDFVAPHSEVFPEALELEAAESLVGVNEPVALERVATFLNQAAGLLIATERLAHLDALANTIRLRNGYYVVETSKGEVTSSEVMIATGAKEQLLPELSTRNPAKTFLSREVLTNDRQAELESAVRSDGRVAVIGGAHSAYSAIEILIREDSPYQVSRVDIVRRTPTKPYFSSAEEAIEYGYEVTAKDSVCQETGKINRFDGIRGVAREVWFREQQGSTPVPVGTLEIDNLDEIDDSVTVIQATGYEALRSKLVDVSGNPIDYRRQFTESGTTRLVVVDENSGSPIHAVGLGNSRLDGTALYYTQAKGALNGVK